MPVHGPPDLILYGVVKRATVAEWDYIIRFAGDPENAEKLRKELLRIALIARQRSTSVPALPQFIREGVDTIDSILAPLTSEAKKKLIALLEAMEKMEPATHIPTSVAIRRMLELSEHTGHKKDKESK